MITLKKKFMLAQVAKNRQKRLNALLRAPSLPSKIRNNLGFYLVACDFRLTWKCNSQCIFCDIWRVYRDPETYVRDHGTGLQASSDEMSTEEIKKVIDDLKRMKTKNVTFSGGEPTLRSDLCELIAHAHRNGMTTVINTNGIAITESYAERLVTSGLTVANFSIDGPTAELHDGFRGKGVFERAVRGLKAIRAMSEKHGRYVWINVNAVITKKNYESLTQFIERKKEWGFDSFSVGPVNVSENEVSVSKNTDEFRLEVEDIRRIKEIFSGSTLKRFRDAGLLTVLPFGDTDEELEQNARNCYTHPWQYCIIPWIRTVVQPNGDVLPCCYSPGGYVVGNLRKAPIAEIWDGEAYREFRRKCKPISHPICRWCFLFKHTNEKVTPLVKLLNYGAR